MTQQPNLKEVNKLASLLGRIVSAVCLSYSVNLQLASAQDFPPEGEPQPSLEERLSSGTGQTQESEDHDQAVLSNYANSGAKLLEKNKIKVIDGDTIHYLEDDVNISYRLADIDAPEHNQHGTGDFKNVECGKDSSDALRQLLEGANKIYFISSLTAPSEDPSSRAQMDRYGRELGYLMIEMIIIRDKVITIEYVLVNAQQVRTGNALSTGKMYSPSHRDDLAALVNAACTAPQYFPLKYKVPWVYRHGDPDNN